MEQFKSIEDLTQIDKKHFSLALITGQVIDLEAHHAALAAETLNEEVPEDLQSQFNIAKNMALYTYYFYALAPEVHLKTYTIIEHALCFRIQPEKHMGLRRLLAIAVKKDWICDAGFRHLETTEPGNEWCREMVDVIPEMRNNKAHGSTMLTPESLHYIAVCADFLNQLFPKQTKKGSA